MLAQRIRETQGNMSNKQTIKNLQRDGQNGDIKSLFQLAMQYQSGKQVEPNKKLADEYFKQVSDFIASHPLCVDTLALTDFARFEDLEVSLSNANNGQANLTVFIGNNGAGKTTLLNAIGLSLSWLMANIIKQGKNGHPIEAADINHKATAHYASVLTRLKFTDNLSYEVALSKSKDGSKTATKGLYADIRQLGDMYRYANAEDDNFNLPLLAFYPVERSIEVERQDLNKLKEIVNRNNWCKLDGYKEALKSPSSFSVFFRWFRHFDDIHNAQSQSDNPLLTAIEKVKAELNSDIIHQLEKKAQLTAEPNTVLTSFKQEKERELEALQAQLSSDHQPSRLLKQVIGAIANFMPEFSHLRIQRSPIFDMLVDKEGLTLSVLQLSQGEKTLMALVGDIARRLVMLTPSLDNPLAGNGVVLIDEIDLHLHPDWQQKVVGNLQRTFPNIQFILTTHSPQVLTTVPAQSIRIIKQSQGKTTIEIPEFSLGSESNVMLQELQGVSSRPKSLPIVQDLDCYLALVKQQQWDSPQALELRAKLDAWAGEYDPVLMKTDMDIRLRKRRNQSKVGQ